MLHYYEGQQWEKSYVNKAFIDLYGEKELTRTDANYEYLGVFKTHHHFICWRFYLQHKSALPEWLVFNVEQTWDKFRNLGFDESDGYYFRKL
jgi:hypothetical protein